MRQYKSLFSIMFSLIFLFASFSFVIADNQKKNDGEQKSESRPSVKEMVTPKNLRQIGINKNSLSNVPLSDLPLEKIDVGVLVGGADFDSEQWSFFKQAFRGNIASKEGQLPQKYRSSSGKRQWSGNRAALSIAGYGYKKSNNQYIRTGVAPGTRLHIYQGAFTDSPTINREYKKDQWSANGTYNMNMAQVLKGLDSFQKKDVDVAHLGFSAEAVWKEGMMHDAIQSLHEQNTTLVTGAGNESEQVDGGFLARDTVPAVYDETIAVGALSSGSNPLGGSELLKYASYSNYGENVDIAAPAFVRGTMGDNLGVPIEGGTQQAASLVTGTVAIMKATAKKEGEQLRLDEIRNDLHYGGDSFDWSSYPSEDVGQFSQLDVHGAYGQTKMRIDKRNDDFFNDQVMSKEENQQESNLNLVEITVIPNDQQRGVYDEQYVFYKLEGEEEYNDLHGWGYPEKGSPATYNVECGESKYVKLKSSWAGKTKYRQISCKRESVKWKPF